jgi:two-component system, NarL family, response regulator NreC
VDRYIECLSFQERVSQNSSGMVRIVLADGHCIVRKGLMILLNTEAEFSVIGEASDSSETLKTVKAVLPDVLVMDLMLPGVNGLEIIRQLHKTLPSLCIVVLTMYNNLAYVTGALESGARAYVLKESRIEDLTIGIREAVAGKIYLSPPLTQESLTQYRHRAEHLPDLLFQRLTARERQIIELASAGKCNADIASKLKISKRTVETHKSNLMHKIGLHSQAQLSRFTAEEVWTPRSSLG